MNVAEEMIVAYHRFYPHGKFLMVINFMHGLHTHFDISINTYHDVDMVGCVRVWGRENSYKRDLFRGSLFYDDIRKNTLVNVFLWNVCREILLAIVSIDYFSCTII